MQHLSRGPLLGRGFRRGSSRCLELSNMLHRLCGPPSIPLSFSLAAVVPRRCAYRVGLDAPRADRGTPGTQRLRRGLPGYLILFATHALVPEGQSRASRPPSPSVFFRISTHSTATPGVPSAHRALKPGRTRRRAKVGPWRFTAGAPGPLRTLYAQ